MKMVRSLGAAVVAAVWMAAFPAVAQTAAPAPAPAPAAVALSASHAKAAREVAAVMGLELPITEILNETRAQLVRTYATTRPEISKDLETVLNALVPEIAQQKDDIIQQATQIIGNTFTENELNEMNKFFTSPVGIKYQKEQPAVFQAYVARVQVWQQSLANTIITRVREEMKKKGHTL